MTANVDAMVRAGVEAYRAGNKPEARTLLERAIELDGYNEVAWLWLSAVVDTPAEQQTCLENVLVINPKNERAKQGLRSLGVDPDTIIADAAADQPESTAAFVDESDDYQVPSSSASVSAATPEPTPDQYDEWVDGLNISQDDVASGGSVFSDDDFSASDTFELGETFFSEDDLFADDDNGYDDDVYDEPIDDQYGSADAMYADAGTMDDFSSAMDSADDYEEEFFDDYAEDTDGAMHDEDPVVYDDPVELDPIGDPNQPSPTALFAAIPAEIEPGRLPGENESVSAIHYVIIGILAIVNLGAIGFIALTMFG